MYQAVIVDDESFVLDGMKTAIDWSGFNFEICFSTTDPCHALEFLEHHSADLLITDISMPQMDGIELIKRVRAANPLIFILVLSAFDNFEYVRSAMRHGAENYLLKPLDPDELTESISHIAANIKERAELSGTYGSTILTFRSSFIENWVKGALSEDDFITRAQMLGINLYLDNYTVMVLTIAPSFALAKEKMASLFDYLLSLVVGSYITHFYFQTPTRLVSIISCQRLEYSFDHLLSLIYKARINLNFPFFVSVGNTVDNYAEVGISYRSAVKYLFLKYSPMPGIVCRDLELTRISMNAIEHDYAAITETTYLEQITAAFLALPVPKRMAFLLSSLSFGASYVSFLEQPQPKLIQLLQNIVDNDADKDAMLSYLQEFIHTCFFIYSQKQEAQSASYPCVNAVISAVHEFSDKDISLKTLAAKLNMHPSYLGSIFRQQTGYYFNDYLNEERLKYAAELMEKTDMKLKDIVDLAGFSSQTYFNRQFKRRYDTSPNTYRREVKVKNMS